MGIFKHFFSNKPFVFARPIKDMTTDKRWITEQNLFPKECLDVLTPTELKHYFDGKESTISCTVIYFNPLDTSVREAVAEGKTEEEARGLAWRKLLDDCSELLKATENDFAVFYNNCK